VLSGSHKARSLPFDSRISFGCLIPPFNSNGRKIARYSRSNIRKRKALFAFAAISIGRRDCWLLFIVKLARELLICFRDSETFFISGVVILHGPVWLTNDSQKNLNDWARVESSYDQSVRNTPLDNSRLLWNSFDRLMRRHVWLRY